MDKNLKEARQTLDSQTKQYQEVSDLSSSRILRLEEELELAKKIMNNDRKVFQTDLAEKSKEIEFLKEKNKHLVKSVSMPKTSGLKRVIYVLKFFFLFCFCNYKLKIN